MTRRTRDTARAADLLQSPYQQNEGWVLRAAHIADLPAAAIAQALN